jgi:hypothetical protein
MRAIVFDPPGGPEGLRPAERRPELQRTGRRFVFAVLALVAVACDSDRDTASLATFVFQHRDVPGPAGSFVARTADPAVIHLAREQLALPQAERLLHIEGPIERDKDDQEPDWSWRFVPGTWRLVQKSIELCDGTPQMVEDDLAYWVDQVGSFCPWSAHVTAER